MDELNSTSKVVMPKPKKQKSEHYLFLKMHVLYMTHGYFCPLYETNFGLNLKIVIPKQPVNLPVNPLENEKKPNL